MIIKRPDGSVIPSSSEGIARKVRETLGKKVLIKPAISSISGNVRKFNQPQQTSADEYIVEELKVNILGYAKGKKLTKEGVATLFREISKEGTKNNYYVGITCDPERREGEHEAEFLAVIGCPNKDKANELEKAMGYTGFDAGDAVGNVHNPESNKVYIYKKTNETIE